MDINEIGDWLIENPTAFKDLPQDWQDFLTVAMRGNPSFSPEQLHWFSRWWLAVDEETVDDLNELCPAGFQISGRSDIDGNLFVNASLLTDAVDGGNYQPLRPILESLILTWREPEDWPQPEADQ